MSNRFLCWVWIFLYVVCALLGCIPQPQGPAYGFCVFFSLLFFVPPTVLAWRSIREHNKRMLLLLRNLAMLWLLVTVVMTMVNILSIGLSETAGTVVYYALVLVSSPMICGQIWVISLFLWICLLITAWKYSRKEA